MNKKILKTLKNIELVETTKMVLELTRLLLEEKINKTDLKILNALLTNNKKSIGNISKEVNIAPVNLWKHLKTLQKLNLIKVPDVPRGKPKYPQLVIDNGIIRELIKDKSMMDSLGIYPSKTK